MASEVAWDSRPGGTEIRTGWIEPALAWVTVLFAGNASTFARSLDGWTMPAAPILYILLHIILAWKYQVKFGRRYLFLVGGFTLYFVATTIKYHELHPRFWGIYVLTFTGTYVIVNSLGFRFFILLESCVVVLSQIGLIFWVAQILAPNVVWAVLQVSEIFPSRVTLGGFNNVLYSMQAHSERIPRNCGFAWEPGGFASILVFAIFVNLIRNKLQWKYNTPLWIMILALASTQSTTGWTASGILLIWFVTRQRMWYVWGLALIPIVLLVMTNPVMNDKIQKTMTETAELPIELAIENAYSYDRIYSPQRFASFQIAWVDFKNNPILGFAGHNTDSWMGREQINAVIVSGLGEILRKFGVVGSLFFIISSAFSSIAFAKFFKEPQGGLALFGIILFVGFSYSQILLPYFMAFWGISSFMISKNGDVISNRVHHS